MESPQKISNLFSYRYQTRKYYDSKILQPQLIQIIDFGLSQELYSNSKDAFIGSLNFASRQSHKGEQLGYKDDLESLLYVLVYLRNCKYFLQPQQLCLGSKNHLGDVGKQTSKSLAGSSHFILTPPPQLRISLYSFRRSRLTQAHQRTTSCQIMVISKACFWK
ncbi:unnamed protein product (macronuclear) [Paramecium tetraurelia]|uniref:Protein kinase domain-containing protein n=1 Tax=Paramecium tetraurelia TaxID=5888 RepID=A0BJF1_PARTE|nr:uncharacterized protein GSPATT00029295001 [Paramecium tetraurelia]CAK58668.1 unnamed protein product [Paramecium tetraurelia]|eukprot:XP_001426066.1 hypothetical protein (macronuclear) [Paramecium tetraurelia strain d4-2]